jgi:hypothetical protein
MPARRRIGALIGTAALASVAVVAGASTATAESDQRWFDQYEVAAAHAEGATGSGVDIAVIESVVNPDLPVLAGADLTVDPEPLCTNGGSVTSSDPVFNTVHATSSLVLLLGNGQGPVPVQGIAPEASVTFYGTGLSEAVACEAAVTGEADQYLSGRGVGIARALADGADIISISTTSSFSSFDAELIAQAIADGVVVVAATPNESQNPNVNPWGYNGVVAASSVTDEGYLQSDGDGEVSWADTTVVARGADFTMVGDIDSSWEGSTVAGGSSIAAPLIAGMVADVSSKYPEATGNQLIQTLIHNTGSDEHELTFTPGVGYGAANLTHMLREDPAQYPDENPLMDKSVGEPTVDQVATAGQPADPEQSATPAPDDVASPDPAITSIMPTLLVTAGIALALVVAAAAVTIVLVVRHNKKKNLTQGVQQ